MTPGKIVLTTVLTVFTLLAFVGVAATTFLPRAAEAHGFRAMGGHGGGDRHQRMLQHCERLGPAHTRVVEAMISASLDLNDSQEEALQPIMRVLDDWRAAAAQRCADGEITSIDDGLALAEGMLSASATAVAELRPAWSAFDAQLSDEQRARIGAMLQRHRHH